ncbi:hypothetical protein [Phenylobacterium ferrooxidans]|uniref:Uncharacterized protein n=1 Tax=Phenylobacterium ferrooxidans TaxID=2982689 RepID=A0ABW6CSI0_9CAUL
MQNRPTLVADNTSKVESAVQTAARLMDEAKAAAGFVALGMLGDMVAMEHKLLEVAGLKSLPAGVQEYFRGAARDLRNAHDGVVALKVRA